MNATVSYHVRLSLEDAKVLTRAAKVRGVAPTTFIRLAAVIEARQVEKATVAA